MNNEKENLIYELLNKKAEENNVIDLDVYAKGLGDMYDKLKELEPFKN